MEAPLNHLDHYKTVVEAQMARIRQEVAPRPQINYTQEIRILQIHLLKVIKAAVDHLVDQGQDHPAVQGQDHHRPNVIKINTIAVKIDIMMRMHHPKVMELTMT